ncbi:cold-shock protein [Succinivibrio dextrinosolvens]|uniref:cold-shock protein n=1 Tax=Succinivibrio dextrinosolvens TaxID=83771 RepID=UPI00241E9B08|nr:cold shock domain-containing protein [Succinivibrio dextrinosolvens]MBE6424318.1 cold shock domain-containing protein [Succinivibrio dextrinosolvens]
MEFGIVKSFVEDKGYGFIQAEHKSVFFHLNDVFNDDKDKIKIGQAVKFDEIPSPKGNKAVDVSIANIDDLKFTFPNEPIILKDGQKLGGEYVVLDISDYELFYSSRDPSGWRDIFKEHLKFLGANAVIGLNISQTTGEEPGTGNGTHLFTIHNYFGRVAKVGKISSMGIKSSQIQKLNDAIEDRKAEERAYLEQKDKEFTKKRNILTACIFVLSLLVTILVLMLPLLQCFMYSIGIAFLACIIINWLQTLSFSEKRIDDFLRKYEDKISIGGFKVSKREIRY